MITYNEHGLSPVRYEVKFYTKFIELLAFCFNVAYFMQLMLLLLYLTPSPQEPIKKRPIYNYLRSHNFEGGGDRGSAVFKVLCYKSEGRWFDLSWCQWIFR